MQIVVNNSSSMKPVNVLNNFYTEILLFSPLKVLAHREGMAKDLASFRKMVFASRRFGFKQMSGLTFN